LLLIIAHTTVGKWWFSFEKPAQNHSASWTAFAPPSQASLAAKTTTVVQ
jgi:hypothetical protein